MPRQEYVVLEAAVYVRETPKAYLVFIGEAGDVGVVGENQFWIPKSVIDPEQDLDSFSKIDDVEDLSIAKWFAEKEGLEDFVVD